MADIEFEDGTSQKVVIMRRRMMGMNETSHPWRIFNTEKEANDWLTTLHWQRPTHQGAPWTDGTHLALVVKTPHVLPPKITPRDLSADPSLTEKPWYATGWGWAVEDYPQGWRPLDPPSTGWSRRWTELVNSWKAMAQHAAPSPDQKTARYTWIHRGYTDAMAALKIEHTPTDQVADQN